MFNYRIYGLLVKSDTKFPEVEEWNAEENSDVRIHKADLNTIHKEIIEYQDNSAMKKEPGETAWLVYKYSRETSIVCFPGKGIFQIINGRTIEYMNEISTNSTEFRQLVLCMCFGILLIQREQIVIHGSGMTKGGTAFIISGESGVGKSTLTNALLGQGYEFMADDAVALTVTDKIYACGAYPQRKLCENIIEYDGYDKEKLRYIPDGGKIKYGVDMKESYRADKEELRVLLVLSVADIDTVLIEEIQGNEKLKYIINNLYKRETYKKIGFTTCIFEQCVKIADNISVYEIKRPKDKFSVREQVELLKPILLG